MKIAIDIDQLLAQQKITQEEYNRLKVIGAKSNSSLVFNILIGFGVTAVSLALMAVIPSPYTAIAIGGILFFVGIILLKSQITEWEVLAQICIFIGALVGGTGSAIAGALSIYGLIIPVFIYAFGALYANSGFLITLATLLLGIISVEIFSRTSIMATLESPLVCIVIFSVIGFCMLGLSLSTIIAAKHKRLAIISARTCLIMVNVAFFIGSILGDYIGSSAAPYIRISSLNFSVMWAFALIAAGIWAWSEGRIWVLNVVTTFGILHYLTQWFIKLGSTPFTVLVAGNVALVLALMIKQLNSKILNAT